MLENQDSGAAALGRKDGGGMAGAASGGGRSWEAEAPVLNPPPEQTYCEGSAGQEEGDSTVRCLVGQCQAGLMAGPEEPGTAPGQVSLQAQAWRRPGQTQGRPRSRPGVGEARFQPPLHTDEGHHGVGGGGTKRAVFGGENSSE